MKERAYLIKWSEIEPLCVIRLLLRKIWLIVLAALIGVMGASIILTCLVSRSYSSTATFVVTSRVGGAVYYTNTSAASEVAAIYSKLLQSDIMNETVHEALGSSTSGTISAQQLGKTNLITVTVTSDSPKEALSMIQAIIENYAELSDYVSSKAVLSVLDTPSITAVPSRFYNETKISILAGLFCGCAMAAILIWMSLSSGTIQNQEGAKNNLDAKIITAIPHEKQPRPRLRSPFRSKGKRLRENLNISTPTISFAFAESIHRVAAKFEHEHAKGKTVFLFSSVSEAEGKSTLAANTALSLAEKQANVLFIDLDLRRPVQNELLGLDVTKKNEFGSLLAAGTAPDKILDAVIKDPSTGLSTLLSTKSYSDMIELISSHTLVDLLVLARTRFDYVIIDSPPLGYFADSELLSDLSDASVLVVRQDTVPAAEINDTIDALRAGKAEFLGCILNDMSYLSAHTSGYGYGYGYGGKYGGYGKYGKYGKYGSTQKSDSK